MGKFSHDYCRRCYMKLVRYGKLPYKHKHWKDEKDPTLPLDEALREEEE